jgi:crotonobetainyl-CoA:carnitine CoA-transferase CaiB-like acyl-CoA transferase
VSGGLDIRVIDLTNEAGVFASRMLVGLGADVVRVEPIGGDPMRLRSDVEFAHWNAGKRSVRLDLAADHGLASLLEMCAGADVLIESRTGGPGTLLDPEELARRCPHLVHVSVTPFGSWGPRSDWRGSDLIACAAGGMMALSGESDGPPMAPPREQAYHLAGANAAIGALLGLSARRRTGGGQRVEVSMQEAVASTLEYGALTWIHGGERHRRDGSRYPHVPHRLFRCRDGFVAGGYGGSPRMWDGLVAWMDELGMAEPLTDPRYADASVRFAERGRIDQEVETFTQRFDRAELVAEAQRRRLPWASVETALDVAFNPQLLSRRSFAWIETEDRCVRDVGFAFEYVRGSRPVHLRVPPMPEPVGSFQGWTSPPRARAGGGSRRGMNGALDGIRVLDLTWVLAGPYATKIMADHGADVIKVESRHRPDPTRFSASMHLTQDTELHPDRSGYFNNFNRNKRGITLNLRRPEGLAVLARLVPRCDLVVENFSAGLLERWGFGYHRLRALRDDVILVRMAGMGQSGPWSGHVTYADTLAAMAGITAQTAPRNADPVGVAFGLGDMIAALHAVAGALAALEDRERTGLGREIDLSQLEAVASHTGTSQLEAAYGLPSTSYDGNRHPRMAPHGAFRCLGEDRWIAVAVDSDEQWRALAVGIGRPELSERFATLQARKANEAEVERFIEAWTEERTPEEAAARLQAAGVPAAPVEDGCDLVEHDEHLRARGFYVELEHPAAGPMLHEGISVLLSETPGGVRRPAPRLGEHTDEVLTTVAGMTAEEVSGLRDAGVLE